MKQSQSVKPNDEIAIEIAVGAKAVIRNRPKITPAANYVTVLDTDGGSHVVPEAILLVSTTLRQLFRSQHQFAEHSSRTVSLDHLSSKVVTSILHFCFRYYLESYLCMQPLDATPPPTVPAASMQSLDSLDEPASKPEAESLFVLPNLNIQHALTMQDAYPIFLAAHYLQIPPLMRLCAAFIAQYLDRTRH